MLAIIIILIILCIILLLIIFKDKEDTSTEYTQDQRELINCITSSLLIYADNECISIHRFGISRIEYIFKEDSVDLIFHTATPGMLIGKGGNTIDEISTILKQRTHNLKYRVDKINIKEHYIWRTI